jgi:hypothetical protein
VSAQAQKRTETDNYFYRDALRPTPLPGSTADFAKLFQAGFEATDDILREESGDSGVA